jgi:hypothetical protein
MARIRSVKPELRDSRVVASWPVEVRYFWVLVWGYLDDYGRGLDMPKKIAGDCFPHEEDPWGASDIDKWLTLMGQEFEGRPGPICRYVVAGTPYVHATNWNDHQHPNRPTPSRIPPCPFHASLRESHSEPLDENSVPGAAEQGNLTAGEQRQAAHEPRMEHSTPAQRRIVTDVTDATDAEADAVVALVQRESKPTKMGGFLNHLKTEGELSEWLDRVRADRLKAETAARLRVARDGPECEHRLPGGREVHPENGLPRCPLCRAALEVQPQEKQ